MKNLTCILVTLVVFLASNAARAELRLANIFNDHMVLQQEKPLTIWGWAEPGADVTVTLTESEQQAVTVAGEEALRREEPPTQANEEKPKPIVRIEYVHENAPEFNTVTRRAQAGADGRWSVEIQPLAASFRPKFLCAVSGDQKTALIDVLVGEVWVTAGQSNMAYAGDKTGWLSKEGLLLPGLRYAHTGRASNYKPLPDLAERAAWLPCNEQNVRGLSTIPYLFGKYLHSKLQVPVGVINAASGGAHGNFWCSLEEMHQIDFWTVKQMMAAHDQAVAEWEDEASQKKLIDAYEEKYAAERAEWEKAAAAAQAEGKRPPAEPKHNPPRAPQSPYKISCLYNGRIVPIGPLAIRGALYLQGEQQVLTWCITRYEHIFPRIITSFRKAFGDEQMPFGIITLQGAGHNKMPMSEIGAANRTAIVREMHYKTHLATPHTGFIPAHDVGRGLHPSWKRPLAERAVHWALRDVYKTIPDKSYSLDKVEFDSGRVYVHIVQRGERRKRVKGDFEVEVVQNPVGFASWSGNDSQYLGGFLIAGADRRWYPAKVLPDGEKKALEVWSDLVDEPVALRYGWASYPVANLGPWENPVPPFRTDNWPVFESISIEPELQQKCRSDWYKALDGRYADMLDRTIRQGNFDAARSEMLLYGDAAKILRRKAERIADILGEITPDFYRNDNLRKINFTDWTIRRCNEARLGKAEQVPDQMVELMKDERLQEKIEKLRQALDEYRQAVEQLEEP
jgi:sialate O-acetylesterase